MLNKLFIFLLLLLTIFSCAKSNTSNDNLLIDNKNIKNIFIIDNKLFFCEQNEDSTFKIVDNGNNEIVANKMKFKPDAMVRYKSGYLFGFNDIHSARVVVWSSDYEESIIGEMIWKNNQNFLVKKYQYLGGKEYRVSLVSFPTNTEIEFYNYAIANPKGNTSVVIVNNDTTSILTPDLKLLSKTKNTYFTIYDGKYFELELNSCQIFIDKIKFKFCYDRIIDIKYFNDHFYVLFQQGNSIKLINDEEIIIDSFTVKETVPISMLYHNSKLQIAFVNISSQYLNTRQGKTKLLSQYFMDNGDFYSIEEKENKLFIYNENNQDKFDLGNLNDFEDSNLNYDYFHIRTNKKVLIIDKNLKSRGFFEGYKLESIKNDSNLFILTSEGKVYKF